MRRECEIRKTTMPEIYEAQGMLASQFEGVPAIIWTPQGRLTCYTAWAQFDNDAKPRGVGHIVLRIHPKEIEIVSLGVSKILRRCGIATRLVQEAIWLTRRPRPLVTCNLPSPLVELWPMEHLLNKCGFDAVKIHSPDRPPFWNFAWELHGEAPAIEQLDPEERATLQWP